MTRRKKGTLCEANGPIRGNELQAVLAESFWLSRPWPVSVISMHRCLLFPHSLNSFVTVWKPRSVPSEVVCVCSFASNISVAVVSCCSLSPFFTKGIHVPAKARASFYDTITNLRLVLCSSFRSLVLPLELWLRNHRKKNLCCKISVVILFKSSRSLIRDSTPAPKFISFWSGCSRTCNFMSTSSFLLTYDMYSSFGPWLMPVSLPAYGSL